MHVHIFLCAFILLGASMFLPTSMYVDVIPAFICILVYLSIYIYIYRYACCFALLEYVCSMAEPQRPKGRGQSVHCSGRGRGSLRQPLKTNGCQSEHRGPA